MTPSFPTAPNWDGNHLGALVPALLREPSDRPAWLPASAQSAKQVVLLVLDGLGADAVHAYNLPTISSMEGGEMPTVCPATTAAALTSLVCGCLPGRHGVTGFRVRVRGDVLNVLRWRTQNGTTVIPHQFQPLSAFGGALVPVIAPAEYERSGFTQAHLRGLPYRAALSRTTSIELAAREVSSGTPLVYVYDAVVDQVAHRYGLRDGMYEAEARSADLYVAAMLERLPSDVALIVTADHGQVHIEGWIELPEEVQAEVAVAAGDARFRSLYAYPGRASILHERARAALESQAWVMTREELEASGWLGPVSRTAAERLGDVIVIPHGTAGIYDPTLPGERGLRSAHGGFDPAETTVPLRAAWGRGGTA